MPTALYNGCPACLIERGLESDQPEKSKLEERLRAQGLTQEEIAKKVSSIRKELRRNLHALFPNLSKQDIQRTIDQAEKR